MNYWRKTSWIEPGYTKTSGAIAATTGIPGRNLRFAKSRPKITFSVKLRQKIHDKRGPLSPKQKMTKNFRLPSRNLFFLKREKDYIISRRWRCSRIGIRRSERRDRLRALARNRGAPARGRRQVGALTRPRERCAATARRAIASALRYAVERGPSIRASQRQPRRATRLPSTDRHPQPACGRRSLDSCRGRERRAPSAPAHPCEPGSARAGKRSSWASGVTVRLALAQLVVRS